MGIAVTGMAFEDSLDNGGKGIIFPQISQSDKGIQRKLVFNNGVIVKNKGHINYIGCNVTGSNDGTLKDPKFKFKMFFEKCLLPVIDKLVCDGDTFEGFDPVIQGDNSVTHQYE